MVFAEHTFPNDSGLSFQVTSKNNRGKAQCIVILGPSTALVRCSASFIGADTDNLIIFT